MVTKRRRLTPDARRVELLEAAIDVIRDRGPGNTRVEDITNAAGAAKGTFYLYFPSWDDLLIAVCAHILETYKSDIQSRFEAARNGWWDAFEYECVHFIDYTLELGGLHEAIFHGPIAVYPIDPDLSADALIAGMLEEGIASGACRPVDIAAASRFIFSVLHSAADDIVESGERERTLDTMFDLLRRWLRIPNPDAVGRKVSSPKEDTEID
jgi:AcrR family transcriptional regulator